jgi:hypothetical protein
VIERDQIGKRAADIDGDGIGHDNSRSKVQQFKRSMSQEFVLRIILTLNSFGRLRAGF